MEGLTPGRIVHYAAADGNHYAAIVTATFPDAPGRALLTVFLPTGPVMREAPYSTDPSWVSTWHWIERD